MQINEAKSRFEILKNDGVVYADFEVRGDQLVIPYVYAPPQLRGSGAAGELMQEVLDYSREKNLKIVPICGYAAAWLKRNT